MSINTSYYSNKMLIINKYALIVIIVVNNIDYLCKIGYTK